MSEFDKPTFSYPYQVNAQIQALRTYRDRDTEEGRDIPAKTPSQAWEPASRHTALRHTANTLLYEKGASRDELVDLLGHWTTRIVDGHYLHGGGIVVNSAKRWNDQ